MAQKKLSAQTRADLQKVFDGVGTDRLREWIDAVATGNPAGRGIRARAPNPGRAAELMLALAEYCAPKLARVEQTGAGGGPLRVLVKTVVGGG